MTFIQLSCELRLCMWPALLQCAISARASNEHSRSLKLYDHGDEDSPYYGAPYNLFVVDQIQCVLFVG